MRVQDPVTGRLGQSLPPDDIHALSVSLPSWQDTVGWANRDPSVLTHLRTGYPRFFIHRQVDKLAQQLLQWATLKTNRDRAAGVQTDESGQRERPSQLGMLFPHVQTARRCMGYLGSVEQDESYREAIYGFQVSVSGDFELISAQDTTSELEPFQTLYLVAYPEHLFKEAKAFWQHTGFGLSGRHAMYWSDKASFLQDDRNDNGLSKHFSSLPLAASNKATGIIKERLCSLFSSDRNSVQPDDVFLYPTGMSAIESSAAAICALYQGSSAGPSRVVVFGFLYVDTFKLLSKVKTLECKLYGRASSSDLDQLEVDLKDGMRICALYTEFPGNPLLGSPDLHRLQKLSRQFNFHLVVDDTTSTAVNLDLSPYCDVICTSLSKMFSGACNVMGGSVTICPGCRDKQGLRDKLISQHIRTYFPLDVLVMEENSRDLVRRMSVANRNAEAMADRLRGHPSVERVFYPRGSETQQLYERYRKMRDEAGYGYLLSIRFVSPAAAMAFYEALELAKGPSFGTNFTLCCAYTLLAHAAELEWAAEHDVVEHLIRMSVGIESRECLEGRIDVALDAAAKCGDA